MRKLVWLAIGICCGCALGVYAFGSTILIPFCVIATVVSIASFCIFKGKTALIFLGFAVGLCYTVSYNHFYLSGTENYDGITLHTAITVTDYSEKTPYGIRAEGEISLENKTYAVLLYGDAGLEFCPGDILEGRFTLRLTAPGGSKEMAYYQGQDVWFIAYPRDELTVTKGDNSSLRYFPQRLRRAVLNRLDGLFPEDTIGFAKALLLGETEDLSYAQDTDLKISGIRHIVAVSGLHVSILFALIYLLAGKKRYLTALLGIPLLLIFALTAGLTPSILRACLMQVLMMLALLLNREYDPPSAFSFAVIVILALNPFSISSVSFQLSCGCILGIFLFSGRFQRHFHPITKGFTLGKKLLRLIFGSLSVTVGTMIVTAPLSAYYFDTISLIGLLTNLLTLPIVTIIFYGILAALVLSFILMPLGSFVAAVISLLMRYVLLVADILSNVPFAAVYTSSVYICLWLLLCYVLFAVFWLRGKKHMGLTVGAMVALLLAASAFSFIEPRLDDYRVTVLDVGQGQSILIQSKGETYLVDCGGSSNTGTADTAANALLSQGISHIDGVILTHYDSDHIGGLSYFLERIHADILYLPNGGELPFSLSEDQNKMYLDEIITVTVGIGKLTLIPGKASEVSNDCSTCVLFQAKECDILITGDRSITGEELLMKQFSLPKLEILVAGHHGADNATGFKLLEQTHPDTVIISVAKNNFYGHPGRDLLNRLNLFGCRILRTDRHGNIIIRG